MRSKTAQYLSVLILVGLFLSLSLAHPRSSARGQESPLNQGSGFPPVLFTRWTRTYDGGCVDSAFDISCDSDGNPVVVGYTEHEVSDGFSTYNDKDIWVRKYTGTTGATIWTEITDGEVFDEYAFGDVAYGVSCGPDGNPVVVGHMDTDEDTHNYCDIWVAKYDGVDGHTIWQKTHDSGWMDKALGVSCGPDGDPVVAGLINTPDGGDERAWVRKFDGDNGDTIWEKVYLDPLHIQAFGIACDPSGNPFVTLTGPVGMLVRKLSASNGDTLWESTYYDCNNQDRLSNDVSCGPDGNPVVVVSIHGGAHPSDIGVRKHDGATGAILWEKSFDGGRSDEAFDVFCDSAGNVLVAGSTYPSSGKGNVWVRKYLGSNGQTRWTRTYDSGGDDYGYGVTCDPDGIPIVAGKCNDDIWVRKNPATKFSLSEGTTREAFDAYLCIGNVGSGEAEVKITYLKGDGKTATDSVTIPKNSRATVFPRDKLGTGEDAAHDFSCEVECTNGQPIIVERPTYFNYEGKWTGGHNVMGATSPAKTWYFAEGTTREGFEEYITVQNPSEKTANLTFRYMVEGEGETVKKGSVPPTARATFKAADHVGQNRDISLMLTSSEYVVAERPMYFDYQGKWTGGHCVLGANSPSKEWYFAEGTTRAGFEEWLCLQNPSTKAITVEATYLLGPGQGDPVEKSYTVPPKERLTVDVNRELGPGKDVSVKLTSDMEFIAERPMYFLYHGEWDGGHDVLGATSPAKDWYFAEGYTGDNFEEWLCVQNPNDKDARLEVTYYPSTGTPITRPWTVPANTRLTIDVNKDAGPNLEISAAVTSDQPVIVERPMYFNYKGKWTGGHDVVGFSQ